MMPEVFLKVVIGIKEASIKPLFPRPVEQTSRKDFPPTVGDLLKVIKTGVLFEIIKDKDPETPVVFEVG